MITTEVVEWTDPRVDALHTALFAETGAPVDAEGYPAVDELFAQIAEAIAEDAYLIRVSYDPALGYPTEVYVDRSPQIADEELSLSASELVPAGR